MNKLTTLLFLVCALFASAQSPKITGNNAAYDQWLHEDVAFIVTDQEAAEFKLLKNDDDRDRFIIAFWSRRDPTPETTKNEFKEEHYRRIAYSDVHFADTSPGWKTDRGRIYITYGPPDSIDSPPASRNVIVDWHYQASPRNNHARDFRFVDECRCGQYRLQHARVE